MTAFDPNKHRVVAVPYRDDDPERGQHFHVDLASLVEAAKAAAATALVPQQSGELVAVPAFEERKIAALESRLATALARIDELENRPAITGSDLEDIRRAISGRIQELIKDEVAAALSQHQAMRELRETIERVSKETAPSKIMEKISKVSHDVANLSASTADTLQVVEEVVADAQKQMHACMADALSAVHEEMQRARDGFREDITTRIDRAFRQSA